MTSIPLQSVHHVEDFGNILLQAHQDLERVRSRLEATQGDAPGGGEDWYTSLKEVLNRAQTNLRVKGEIVLKSVEDNKLNTLSAITNYAHTQPLQGAHSTALVNQDFDGGYGSVTTEPSSSDATLPRSRRMNAATFQRHQRLQRRPHGETVREQRTIKMLSAPQRLHGREYLQKKYNIKNQSPLKLRPIAKYGPSKDRPGQLYSAKISQPPKILPKIYRRDPKHFPVITPEDTQQGVLNLVNRGLIPSFVDVGPAFDDQAPFRQQPAIFHNFHEQFNKGASFVAPHSFNLANVRLDLAEALFKDEEQKGDETGNEKRLQDSDNDEKLLLLENGHTENDADPNSQLVPYVEEPELPPTEEKAPTKELLATTSFNPDFPGAPWKERSVQDDEQEYNDEKKIRDYDELLDTYSLHQFMIRKGKTLSSTPEFLSFQRKYAFMWGPVENVIRLLEDFLTKYSISLAYVNGQKVVELAEDELQKPDNAALLACLENINKVELITKIPGQRYLGPDGVHAAATKIQATMKMYRQRRLYLMHKSRDMLARMIQRAWKSYKRLQETRQIIAKKWQERLSEWRSMWGSWKSKWNNLARRERVIVHIPSLSLQPYQRRGLFNFALRQNSQLSRLCDVADPNVSVLYIAPFDINVDIHQYYMKLLQVGGVPDAQDRIKIMVPENYTRFPEHFSLAKVCLYSPKLLKRIRDFIRGRPAYIVPHELGPEDLQLAVELSLPMLSGEPDVCNLFSSKSGAKRIFQAAGVPIPPGAHDVYDEEDFYGYFAKLIIDHLETQRWVFKIDNESGGRGIAYFNPTVMKTINALRREKENHPQRWGLPEIVADAHDRIVRDLQKYLPSKVVLVTPTIYEGKWSNFASAFYRVGGVIEACPNFVIGSPSANLFIEPDGTINITSTHDQLFSSPYLFAGACFPSSGPANVIHDMATRIGKICFQEDITGYLGIDFVVYLDPVSEQQKVCAVDLNLRMTATQATFNLFDFLMQGTYNKPSRKKLRKHVSLNPKNPRHNQLNRATYTLSIPDRKSSIRGGSSVGSDSIQPYSSSGYDTKRNSRRGSSTNGSALGSSTLSSGFGGSQVERCYAVMDYVYQPNLATVQFGAFFNLCRLKGVSFDLRAKAGTAFLMMDSLASGTLGLLSAGQNHFDCLQSLTHGLSFLVEQVGLLKLGSHVYDNESNLSAVLAASRNYLQAAMDLEYLNQNDDSEGAGTGSLSVRRKLAPIERLPSIPNNNTLTQSKLPNSGRR